MLRHQLVHPKINEVLGRAGHHGKILIADGNYPASSTLGPNAELVSLNLAPGIVSCTQVLTALASAFTGRKVKPFLAMTGEITLRGKVLPVGGIKEKILAAKRAGMKEILLCRMNEKDISEINPEFIKGLHFQYVDKMKDVLDYALESGF